MGDEELEQYLRDNLEYCPDSGLLTWSKNLRKRKRGQIVGSKHVSGYLIFSVGFNNKSWSLRVHRVCWFLHYGTWPDDFLDHVNGIKDDNRISNLRPASYKTNNLNISKSSANKSGYKGVSWCKEKKKWVSRIGVNGRHLFLGRFNCKTAAALAYDKASLKYHKEFGKRNFIK